MIRHHEKIDFFFVICFFNFLVLVQGHIKWQQVDYGMKLSIVIKKWMGFLKMTKVASMDLWSFSRISRGIGWLWIACSCTYWWKWQSNPRASTSKVFSNMTVNCTWSNRWHHHNARSLLLTLTAPWLVELPLKLNCGQLFISPDTNRLCPLLLLWCSWNTKACFLLEYPLLNFIGDKFQSLLENDVSGD